MIPSSQVTQDCILSDGAIPVAQPPPTPNPHPAPPSHLTNSVRLARSASRPALLQRAERPPRTHDVAKASPFCHQKKRNLTVGRRSNGTGLHPACMRQEGDKVGRRVARLGGVAGDGDERCAGVIFFARCAAQGFVGTPCPSPFRQSDRCMACFLDLEASLFAFRICTRLRGPDMRRCTSAEVPLRAHARFITPAAPHLATARSLHYIIHPPNRCQRLMVWFHQRP